MNGKKVVSTCYPLCNEIVSGLGYVLVDIEYKKQVSGMVLELFIDSDKVIFRCHIIHDRNVEIG